MTEQPNPDTARQLFESFTNYIYACGVTKTKPDPVLVESNFQNLSRLFEIKELSR